MRFLLVLVSIFTGISLAYGLTQSQKEEVRSVMNRFRRTGIVIPPSKLRPGNPYIIDVGIITGVSKLLELYISSLKQCGTPKPIYFRVNPPCNARNTCYGVCFEWFRRLCKPRTCKNPYCERCSSKGFCYGAASCTYICRKGIFKFPFLPKQITFPFSICQCCRPRRPLICSQRPWLGMRDPE